MGLGQKVELQARVSGALAPLANEPCAFLPQVPSGFALRGLRCSGSHCDNKDVLCCPYLGEAPDPSAKEMNSRWISEEFPHTMQSKKFLDGLSCRGPFCDDILASPFKSSRLVNTRECEWGPWNSEQPGQWLDCALGRFVSGIRCREHFCGEISLYCCGAQVE